MKTKLTSTTWKVTMTTMTIAKMTTTPITTKLTTAAKPISITMTTIALA